MTMKLRNVPFSPPDMTEAEANEVRDAILSGWITTGPRTKKLEKEVAEFVGVDKAVCLNSQTACAEMALRLLGIGEGDEVIVPAYTYTASASVVKHVGAKLVFVDVQSDCEDLICLRLCLLYELVCLCVGLLHDFVPGSPCLVLPPHCVNNLMQSLH